MTEHEEWIVLDTETDGMYRPIHAVEIAAQRMQGWQPIGAPFRVLLNHDVPIHPAAEAIHGYSREFLHEHGICPLEAHALFHDFAGTRPIVAYNLPFDWDNVLHPEMTRLQVPISGCKGFCALTLARRTIPEVPNHKLETLKHHFAIQTGRSHQAYTDVATLVHILTNIIRPRLAKADIHGFENIRQFSRRCPIAYCRSFFT